jgi:uncharacterized protein with GYD domain
MPRYLVHGSYTAEGARGLLKDTGTKRRAGVEEMAKSFDGKVEAFCYAFGDSDVFMIINGPDDVTAAASRWRRKSCVRGNRGYQPQDLRSQVWLGRSHHAPGGRYLTPFLSA